jgi:uncharacterized protein YceH (UPF0502 family)
MRRDLSAPEARVLGCLLEKQRTTPEQYPLTLNALRLACNQSTNRDPVTDYDEGTVRDAAQSLGRRRLARLTTGHGGRVAKYRHLLREEVGLADDELAVLCVLMLRGPQTPGELKGRTERLHPFAGLADVEATIERLIKRELALRLERRPGQKEQRYMHLLSADLAAAEPAVAQAVPAPEPAPTQKAWAADSPAPARSDPTLEERVSELETAVRELREKLADLLE